MDRPRPLLVPLIAAMLIAAGCSRPTRSGYPSLAPRPIEKTGFAEPAPPPAAAAAAADPVLDRSIAATSAELDTIAEGFAADAAKAQAASRAAKGQPAGSDKWLDAQTALGTLDGRHAQLSALGTDIDEQAIARAQALGAPYPALDALRARIDAENDAETALIARLQHDLAPA